jgi:hypothetical protein
MYPDSWRILRSVSAGTFLTSRCDVDPLGHLSRLIHDDLSFSDFLHWANAAEWEDASLDNPDLLEAWERIEARIYEYLAGSASEADVRRAQRADLELLTAGLRDGSSQHAVRFLTHSIGQFDRGEIAFNDLLGRAEYLAEIARQRHADNPSFDEVASVAQAMVDVLDEAARSVISDDVLTVRLRALATGPAMGARRR